MELTNIRISTPILNKSVTSDANFIPDKGEVVTIVTSDTDTAPKYSIGNGTTKTSSLDTLVFMSNLTTTNNLINSHTSNKSNPHTVTKAQVGLGNVENLNRASILASAALTGTPTAPTAAAGTNTTQVATTAFVNTAVSNGIAASDAMIFKGTLGTSGTVTALPTTYKTGWTYRVITGGTYAGNVCEVGDLIIALVDRAGSSNANTDWTVAQTNINGALTNITGTSPISVSGSGSTRAVAHASSGVTAGTYRKVTVNAFGHVTAGANSITTIAEGGTNNNTFTGNTVIVYDGSKFASSGISTTKLGYLTDVTSNIQAQINGKAASSHTHTVANITNLETRLSTLLSTALTNESDLNDMITPGIYYAGGANNIKNKPAADIDAFGLHLYRVASGWFEEKLSSGNILTGATYYRTYVPGTGWSEWSVRPRISSAITTGQIIVAEDANGTLKTSGFTIGTSVPAGAKFTDTVYTHPTTAGNKHIPAGGASGQFLKWSAAGTAVWANDNNTTYSTFTGATASAAGTTGLVTAPAAGKQTSFLRGDGTWVIPTNTVYTHPTSDGNKHVPATGTTNNGKVLIAGATAGALSWGNNISITGSAGSVGKSLTVTLDGGTTEGTNKFTFNGSAAKTLNITPASIGTARILHGTAEPASSLGSDGDIYIQYA